MRRTVAVANNTDTRFLALVVRRGGSTSDGEAAPAGPTIVAVSLAGATGERAGSETDRRVIRDSR